MRIQTRAFLLTITLSGLLCWTGVSAQTIFGRISGTVTDGLGSGVPGAKVSIVNEATRLTRKVATDPNGFYVATNLPVGEYRVTVEAPGFKGSTKTGYDLIADGRLTVDFALAPGEVTESVEVSAATGETVNSTSGEVARVIDQSQVQDLALNGRNYMELTALIPGAPLLTDDPLALATSLDVSQPINGTRGNTNNLTVDGGFNLDSGSNGSQINNVGIDFIREVNIKTSNFSAEFGRNSGASINVVTRSGGNQFHGSVFEFLRNDKLDANNFFNNTRGVERPALQYNNFGWSLGGPIIKDKFFFFGGMEWKYIRRFTTTALRTIPTRAERRGDFSGRSNLFLKDSAKTGACNASTRTACFPNPKVLPPELITADGKAIAAVYDALERQAISYVDTPTANNALYQLPNPFDFRQEMVRLDYRVNERHTVYGRYLHDYNSVIDPFGPFINSQLPTIPGNRLRPGNAAQVGHSWMLTTRLINEAKINVTWHRQNVPPIGDSWKRETYGFEFEQLFPFGRYENGIPNINVSGFSTFSGPAGSLISPQVDIAVSDNLSWVSGAHTLKTGVLIVRNRKDPNGRPAYTGSVTFNPSGNPNSTGNSFADALLGNFSTYTEAIDDPLTFFRFTQYEAFVSDNWKVNRKLSLEIGLRYQYGQPTYTQANNITNFDPSLYDPAQAVTVRRDGLIDATKGGNRYNGLIRAGNGVPADELGRFPNSNSPEVLAVPTGAPRGLYEPQHLFAPRFSFAYAPFSDNRTALRGGFGMFDARPAITIIAATANNPPMLGSATFEDGNLANISGGQASALAPFGNISAIDPNLKTPYTMNFSLGLQRELPWGIFSEVTYVGNLGRHLLRQPDINQAPFEALRANAALPSAQRASVNALRPYRGFSAIQMRLSDSTSNYNALQVYATKRKGDLTLSVSYTWSKSLSDSSDDSAQSDDPYNRDYYYGPTSFDRRHIFVTTYTYRLPFFRKLRGAGGAALSGWVLSGITRFQSGQLLTPSGSTSIGGRRADYAGGEVDGPRAITEWFNTSAFSNAPNDRRGTSGVGVIEGPGRQVWNISLRKQFALREKVALQFQADFFNAWNQVNFNNPNVITTDVAYGTIIGAAPGRNLQLGLRLTF
jgi:Carboxypeptidase regulatory-like domain